MKRLFPLFCILVSTGLSAQPAGKEYTFKEIGWTINLPADFNAFPLADSAIQIVPGGKGESGLYKKLILAMNGPSTFVVMLSSCSAQANNTDYGFGAANQQSYRNTTQMRGQGFEIDSASTETNIAGVTFKRFRMTTRKDNHIQNSSIAMTACYNGYYIALTIEYYSKRAEQEIEAMLAQSTFSK